ncbi:reverse transcriptase domain-containing protein [Tanacetum coccineum]
MTGRRPDIARRRRKKGLCPTAVRPMSGQRPTTSSSGTLPSRINTPKGNDCIIEFSDAVTLTHTIHPLTLMPVLGPGITPGARLTCVFPVCSHMSSLESLVKQHNDRAGTPIVMPIRLIFHDDGDGGKRKDGDFKEHWTEEMGYIQGVPEVMQISAFMTNSKCPELARCSADRGWQAASLELGEQILKDVQLRPKDHYQSYVPPRAQDRRLDSLTKLPSEILANELQLQLPPCPPTIAPPKKENLDRYCHNHGEKGHYTNNCYHLKKKLEAALELGKLNHLVKDVRQKGNNKGRKQGNNNDRGRVIYMVQEIGDYNLSPSIKARLTPTQIELVGFSGEQLIPIGKVELGVKFGGGGLFRKTMLKFTVVRASSPYNIILGRSGMRELRAISSTVHAMVKFPTSRGVATLIGRTSPIYECRWSEKRTVKHDEKIEVMESKEVEESGEEKVLVNPAFSEQTVTIGTQLSAECQERLINLLKNNIDVFTWQPSNMIGVPRRVIKHALNVNASMTPVAQKQRVLGSEKSRAVNKETEDVKCAFQELKRLILELPTPTTPESKEILYVYLETSCDAVSSILVADQKGKHIPIRLRRYFEAHPIRVIKDQPIKQILNKLEVSGKLAKYAVELGAYNITYVPRNAVKGQVLADFINKIPVGTKHLEICSLTDDENSKEWTLYTDGASSLKGTTNEVEYESLLTGLRITRKIKVQALKVKVDWKLVACQMNGEFVASNEGMAKYLTKAKEHTTLFKRFQIENIPQNQNQNQKAYVLSKLASVAFNHLTKEILVEVLNTKFVDTQEVNTIVEE